MDSNHLELSDQFLADFHLLREEFDRFREQAGHAPPGPTVPPEELERFRLEVERLEAEVRALRGETSRLRQQRDDDATAHAAALRKHADDFEALRKQIEARSREALQKQAAAFEAERADAARKLEEGRRQVEAARSERTGAVEEEIARRVEALAGGAERAAAARLAESRRQAFAEAGRLLASAASVSLGTRVGALLIDAMLVAAAATAVRLGTAWAAGLPLGVFLVGTLGLFALRSFVSPGNLLLGVSTAKIGPDHRPVGRAGLFTKLACAVLHYGPLIATGVVAVTDAPTRVALSDLGAWLRDPTGSSQTLAGLLFDLFRPGSLGVPNAILMATFAWWGVLLASALLSPAVYPGSPYFRNTTLVESMWRVGLRRSATPAPESLWRDAPRPA